MSPTEKRPQRLPDFRLETMDNELLLFNPKTTHVIYMNNSASVIWQLCDGDRTTGEIVALLSDTYPEAAASMKKDVEETIDLLVTNSALKMV